LTGVDTHGPGVGGRLCRQCDVFADQAAKHLLHLEQDFVDVDDARFELLAAREGEQLARQSGCAVGGALDFGEILANALGQEPLGHPGLYRRLNQVYFDRVAAIDFTMAHDDGQDPSGWSEAEIVLLGVSRVGKTPLSMYLAVLGWRVANVPLVLNLDPSPELFRLDPRRVIGLTMEAGQLVFLGVFLLQP